MPDNQSRIRLMQGANPCPRNFKKGMMQTETAVSLKTRLRVKRIAYSDTKQFILGIHYARKMPCVQFAYGLFDGDYPAPVGIVTYGQPASPWLCKGIAGEENRKHVLELNRLVLYPEYNGGNYASFLVANSLKMLPHGTYVVSYADWGGVASCRICLPGHKLALYGPYKAKDRQILRGWSFPPLCKRRNKKTASYS